MSSQTVVLYKITNKKVKDLTGQQINNLTVIGYAGVKIKPCGQGHSQWHVRCVCGKVFTVMASALIHAKQDSCGCLHADRLGKASITHGARGKGRDPVKHRVWRVWAGMRERCTNPGNKSYHRYGGRGIKTDPRWQQFQAFYDDMFPTYVPGLQIDRKDNDGDYCKDNCQWSNRRAQGRNRSNNILITWDGATLCATDWGRRLGIDPEIIRQRHHRGWSPEKILFTPY